MRKLLGEIKKLLSRRNSPGDERWLRLSLSSLLLRVRRRSGSLFHQAAVYFRRAYTEREGVHWGIVALFSAASPNFSLSLAPTHSLFLLVDRFLFFFFPRQARWRSNNVGRNFPVPPHDSFFFFFRRSRASDVSHIHRGSNEL